MKINGFVPSQAVKNYVQQKKVEDEIKKPDIPVEDNMEMSREVREIQDLKAYFKEIPDIREDVVARLKEKIETNGYQVDLPELADNIIKELTQNIKTGKG